MQIIVVMHYAAIVSFALSLIETTRPVDQNSQRKSCSLLHAKFAVFMEEKEKKNIYKFSVFISHDSSAH